MKKALVWIQTWIFVSVGVYIGKWLWLWQDVQMHPDLYAWNSAPWYMRMIPYTWMAAGMVLLGAAGYILVRRRGKQSENRS